MALQDFIPVIQAFLAAVGIGTEQQQSDELIKKDEARFGEGTGLLRSQLAQLVAQSKGLTNQVTGGFGDLRDRTLAELVQVGGQERRDINARFTGAQSRATQDLTARGLGSSTILPSVNAGFERQRSDALGSLADRLRLARAGADERITGNQLAAQSNLGSQAINRETSAIQFLANAILGRSDIQPFNPALAGVQALEFLKPPPKPEEPKSDTLGTVLDVAKIAAPIALGVSDRNLKQNFVTVDHKDTLEKLDNLDITKWEYRGEASLQNGEHIGPMAQDFKELFDLGDSDTTINLLDAFGVALSAIKALSAKVQVLEEKLGAVAELQGAA